MKIGKLLMIAGIGVGAYMAYTIFLKNKSVSGDVSGSDRVVPVPSTGGIGVQPTGGIVVGQPPAGTKPVVSVRTPCRADNTTVAFLMRQIESNEEQARHFENMIRLAREMPLCSTGQSNVLGCVENEAERQKIISGAQRERDVFAGLAARNKETLQRAGCL